MYWAVLHNWMYFLSLGFNAINIQFLVREIIDGDAKATPSAQSIALSGRVESVDKLLTFCGIGLLSALSDKVGRKPLMAWSAIGFMMTNLIQASSLSLSSLWTGKSDGSAVPWLYLADFVDGCSSCMLPLCQAYITDVSSPSQLAGNLGIFQGLSAGGAFVFAFPIGGILGAKYGPRVPLYLAAAVQFVNALILLFVTPESHTDREGVTTLDWTHDNPMGGLTRLFGHARILRVTAAVYFLANLARSSLDAQFTNYSNIRFGWTQAQSGPVLVMVGFMLAVAPRLLVPRLGLQNSILSGLLIFAAGLTGCGLVPTSSQFVWSIFVVSIGTMCLPALTALLANLAEPHERGALLGAAGSLTELTGAIGSTLYASILAQFTSPTPPVPNVPGMHFLLGAGLLMVAWLIALPGFLTDKDHPAFQTKREELQEHL